MNPPQDIKLKREAGILEVMWADADVKQIAIRDLRCACRCAGCVNEFTGEPILDPDTIPENVGIERMNLVGKYAIQFKFSDNHDTGLFTWEHLQQLSHRA